VCFRFLFWHKYRNNNLHSQTPTIIENRGVTFGIVSVFETVKLEETGVFDAFIQDFGKLAE